MIRRIAKWTGVGILGLAATGLIYLATRPDPGPYVVALRSDTPEQVSQALDAILAGDTQIIYDGNTYPPVSPEQLQVLGMRYFMKANGQTGEPLKGDTAIWIGFTTRISDALRTRTSPQNPESKIPTSQ